MPYGWHFQLLLIRQNTKEIYSIFWSILLPVPPPSPLPLTPGCLAVPRWEQRRNICLELCTNRTKNLPNNLGFVT
jgi:hypothetical protein